MRSREERPKKPDRHGKGKIIIMWLLFMPLFAIGVTCLYAVFNKNAYQSYAGEYNNNKTTNYYDTLENGKEYYLTFPANDLTIHNINGGDSSTYIEIEDIEIIENTSSANFSNVKYIGLYSSPDALTWTAYFSNTTPGNSFTYLGNRTNYNVTFKFRVVTQTNNFKSFISGNSGIFYTYYRNNLSYVSEVFYYAVDKVQQSPLFNWSSNNIVYTGMHSMCTTMNITSTFIPFILTYWILISIIYMLFDIEFTLLWKLHEKIHDLTESL